MKILCIGHSSYDISVTVPNYPEENKKYRIENKVECGGGPAANAAYLLGKWNQETYFAGVVGYDTFGNKIKKEFKDVGVNTELLETNYESGTTFSFILINEQNGNRTVFNCTDSYFKIKSFKINFIPEIILVDGHDYEISKQVFQKYPNAIKIIDAGRPTKEILDLCQHVNYLVCSKEFAETVSGIKIDFSNTQTLANVYLNLKQKYKNAEIVITLEDKGALYQLNNSIKILPAINSEVKDTTGAGDIFHGAFTYGIANNFDLEKTVTISNIAAGLSLKTIGARISIPELQEVMDYYESHK